MARSAHELEIIFQKRLDRAREVPDVLRRNIARGFAAKVGKWKEELGQDKQPGEVYEQLVTAMEDREVSPVIVPLMAVGLIGWMAQQKLIITGFEDLNARLGRAILNETRMNDGAKVLTAVLRGRALDSDSLESHVADWIDQVNSGVIGDDKAESWGLIHVGSRYVRTSVNDIELTKMLLPQWNYSTRQHDDETEHAEETGMPRRVIRIGQGLLLSEMVRAPSYERLEIAAALGMPISGSFGEGGYRDPRMPTVVRVIPTMVERKYGPGEKAAGARMGISLPAYLPQTMEWAEEIKKMMQTHQSGLGLTEAEAIKWLLADGLMMIEAIRFRRKIDEVSGKSERPSREQIQRAAELVLNRINRKTVVSIVVGDKVLDAKEVTIFGKYLEGAIRFARAAGKNPDLKNEDEGEILKLRMVGIVVNPLSDGSLGLRSEIQILKLMAEMVARSFLKTEEFDLFPDLVRPSPRYIKSETIRMEGVVNPDDLRTEFATGKDYEAEE